MRMFIRRSILVGVATLLGVLALNATPAGAATGYANLCPSLKTALCEVVNESHGSGVGVAVDNSSGSSAGDVWVAYGKLVKFDASGNLLAEVNIGSPEEPPPGATRPIVGGTDQVAVDPISGDVYLTSEGAVTKFSSSGVVQLQITETPQGAIEPTRVAVGADGELYVLAGEEVDKFTSSGAFIERFPVPLVQPTGKSARAPHSGYGTIAVDPKGNLYVVLLGGTYATSTQVREYSSAGAPVDCSNGDNVLYEEEGSRGFYGAVAVDPSDGHIFISEESASEGLILAEYSMPCAAPQPRVAGVENSVFGVSGSTHAIYVADSFGGGGIFGIVTLPDVKTGTSPTGVTRTSATVNGTVNPEETSVTTCEFQYGTTTAYGHTVPCAQPLPLEGSSPKPVSAEITGLSLPPASAVHYRLKVGNANGEDVGEDETLYTEPLPPPIVGDLPASGVTQFTATLNGTLKTGEALVDYHFEYGTTTAYGLLAPIPDNYTPITLETVPVSQPIAGLQAGATYHYRLVASSPGATEVKGPDETFTTIPIPAPTVTTGAAEGVGVGAATLNGAIDPHGWDTTYLFQYGTSTAYGQSWPTVPVDMGALEGPQPVVVNVPNLLPNTTYHYRLVASNGGGTSYGPDMAFTTGEYPAQVIQEPVALRTLMVPTETVKSSSKHGKKAKKRKQHTKSRRKTRRKKKH